MIATNQILELWHNKENSWLVEKNSPLDTVDQIVVQSLYSLVSLGTERLVTTQNFTEVLASNMGIPYMQGSLLNDFTYGYSLVGQVISGPLEIKGKFVHLMHPHQNVLAVRKQDVFIIPDSMDPKLATLASNMETAVNAIWDGSVEIGDKILVIGYGIIGAMIALLAKTIGGVEVTIRENNPNKGLVIANAGFKKYDQRNSSDFDVVFNTTSSGEMLQEAIELTRQEGKIVEVSWYGDRSIKVNLGADFHYGRKRIICSQVSQIPYKKQPIWDYKKRKNLVFKLLNDLNPIHLIESEVPFSETPVFFDELRRGAIDSVGVVIKY